MKFLTGFLALLTLSVLSAHGSAQSEQIVNVYSHRHYDSDRALFARFTEKTGIKVKVVEASADELIERIKAEGTASPADVLITVDAGRLERALQAGLLQKITSPVLEANIPPALRHSQGYWFGLTKRARVIIYNKSLVNPAEVQSYDALAGERFKGKVLMRSSSNIYNQSLIASVIANFGPEAAKSLLNGLVANLAKAPSGGDTDNIKAVALAQGEVSWVNTYYYGKLLTSANAEEVKLAQAVGVVFPDQGKLGTHINISGAGVTTHSQNKDNAVKLLEFLSSEEAQKSFAEGNFEYPVNPKVAASEVLKQWGAFKEDGLKLEKLGEFNSQAVKLMDEAGWK